MSILDQVVKSYEKEKEIINEISLMSVEDMIKFISDRDTLTIDGWNDGYNSVRVGLDWNIETGDCFFLIERTNLKLAIRDAMEVLVLGFERWKQWDKKRDMDFLSNVKTYLHIIDNDLSEHKHLLPILKEWIAEREYIPNDDAQMIEKLRTETHDYRYKDAKIII